MKKQTVFSIIVFLLGFLLLYHGSYVEAEFEREPDLRINLECPSTTYRGTEIGSEVNVLIGNWGNTRASLFRVDLVLSSDTDIPVSPAEYSPNFTEDALLEGGRIPIRLLRPTGQSFEDLEIEGPLTIPEDTPPGTYYIGAVIDSSNRVTESDEDNNVALCRIEVACKQIEPISDCSVFCYDRNAPKLKVTWEFGKPPAHPEEIRIIGDFPTTLRIDNVQHKSETGRWVPLIREPFEVSPPNSTEADIPLREIYTGEFRVVFKAEYSCDRSRTFTFVREHTGD